MSNSLAQQWKQTEKPIEPQTGPLGPAGGVLGSGYAARLAVGPGASAGIYGTGLDMDYGGQIFSNQCQKVPTTVYANISGTYNVPLTTQVPLGVVLGTGWNYNFSNRMVEINATPAGNVDAVFTMDQGAPNLTIGEKIEIWLMGFMQAGTVTVLQGGVATGANIAAADWNATVLLPPALGVYRINITAVAVGNTITLRFPITALAQMQIKAISIVRDYSDWRDYAQNLTLMNA